ncbi:MAG: LCP family protein [Bacillota bacterium]|nr:LCP family protein [Bacillota bacterium]
MTKHRFLKRSLLILGAISAVSLLFAGAYLYSGLERIERIQIPHTNEELGIHPWVSAMEDVSIRNIALFGIDSGRNPSDPPHSDSVVLLTIDRMRNKLKVSSILRDTYVNIDGHGKSKLNEAYTYGGPALAVKTLNQNFDLDIKDYVTADFWGLSRIIDSLGGIEINIGEKEVKEINKWIGELSALEQKEPAFIKKSGPQRLDGIQSVSYARIRKIGDGDFDRSLRQRKVLGQLLDKIRQGGITGYTSLVWKAAPYLKSNISTNDMVSTGTSFLLSTINKVEMQRFPLDGYCKGSIRNGIWYLLPQPDIETMAKQLSDYIYKDIKPVPKAPLF